MDVSQVEAEAEAVPLPPGESAAAAADLDFQDEDNEFGHKPICISKSIFMEDDDDDNVNESPLQLLDGNFDDSGDLLYQSQVEIDGNVPSSFMEEDDDEFNLIIDEGREGSSIVTSQGERLDLTNQFLELEIEIADAEVEEDDDDVVIIEPEDNEQSNSTKNTEDPQVMGDPNRIDWLWNGLTPQNDLLVRKVANSEGRFVCAICFVSTDDKAELRDHVIEEHKFSSRYHKCKICEKKFPFLFLLTRHESTHKSENEVLNLPASVIAQIPEKKNPSPSLPPPKLTAAGLLDIQQRVDQIYQQSLTYKCITCDEAFKTAPELLKHESTTHVDPEIAARCKLCGNQLPTFEKLKKHLIRKHKLTGLNRYRFNCNPNNLWEIVEELRKKIRLGYLSNIDQLHCYSRKPDWVKLKLIKNSEAIISKFLAKVSIKDDKEADNGNAKENDESAGSYNQIQDQSPVPDEDKTFIINEDGSTAVDPEMFVARNIEVETHTQRGGNRKQKPLAPQKVHFEEINQSKQFYEYKEQPPRPGENPLLLPHKCEYCGKGFSRLLALKHHEKFHTSISKFNANNLKCQICLRKFSTIYNLQRHMRTCHSLSKNRFVSKCPICLKVFPSPHNLAIHQNCHAVERLHKCNYCDRAYNYASLLKRHMRQHTGDKPYTCSTCGMKFHELVSLKYHNQKIHTLERPHTCEICSKTFILRSDLNKHMNVHVRYIMQGTKLQPGEREMPDFDNQVYLHVPEELSESPGSDPDPYDASTPRLYLNPIAGVDKSKIFQM